MTSLRLKYIILGIILGKKNKVEQPRHNLNSQQLSYQMKLGFFIDSLYT